MNTQEISTKIYDWLEKDKELNCQKIVTLINERRTENLLRLRNWTNNWIKIRLRNLILKTN